MDYKEKVKAAEILHAYVRDWRGRILNATSVVEIEISKIISWYFCKEERRDLFFSEVGSSYFFNFRAKTKVFKKILKKDYQFILDSQNGFLKDLEKLREFRNILAHDTLDVSDTALSRDPKDGVGFIKFSDGIRKVELVNESKFNDWNGTCGMVSSFLLTFKNTVGLPSFPPDA